MKDYSAIQERMKQLEDPFYVPGETHLDLSGCATYRPKTVEKDDGFNVPLADQNHHGSREGWAKHAVLDPEVLSTLASTPNLTDDEKTILRHYESPSFRFHVPGYAVRAEWNRGGWVCNAESDSGERKSFKLGDVEKLDRDRVMTRALTFLTPKLPWRKLTESELLTVARMAPGSPESAIYTYINFALPGIDEDISSDPKYQPLCDEIIWFVFENHTPEFDETAREYMLDRLADRPLTWTMAKELWAMYKEHQFESKQHPPSRLFNPPTVEQSPESIQAGLENLSDEALADLRQRTIRLVNRR